MEAHLLGLITLPAKFNWIKRPLRPIYLAGMFESSFLFKPSRITRWVIEALRLSQRQPATTFVPTRMVNIRIAVRNNTSSNVLKEALLHILTASDDINRLVLV